MTVGPAKWISVVLPDEFSWIVPVPAKVPASERTAPLPTETVPAMPPVPEPLRMEKLVPLPIANVAVAMIARVWTVLWWRI